MTAQVTLTLPEEVLETARSLALRVGRPVQELLAETIELSLRPLGSSAENGSVTAWSDEEVLRAAQAEMAPADDRRLSELLGRQQAAALAGQEQAELQALMQVYQAKLLRKALALQEAVRRGLRGPLEP